MTDDTLYNKLAATAKAHLLSMQPQTPGSNDVNTDAINLHLATSWRADWGHNYFVSTKPPLQGEKTAEVFNSHLAGMARMLRTWTIDITDISVDVQKKTAVVRAELHMCPKNAEEVVNDIIFWLTMDESGERVIKTTEFVDAVASEELAVRMGGGPAKSS